ncbi:hypothetical protein V8B55DRAFT_1522754 [Mucor lusitanicus]
MKYNILAVLLTFISSAIAAAIAPRDLGQEYECLPGDSGFYILPVRTSDPREFVYCLHGKAVIASCPSEFKYYDLAHNTCVL